MNRFVLQRQLHVRSQQELQARFKAQIDGPYSDDYVDEAQHFGKKSSLILWLEKLESKIPQRIRYASIVVILSTAITVGVIKTSLT